MDSKKRRSEKPEEEEQEEKKTKKTWAGRFIPDKDGPPLRKMSAVKKVWEEFISTKLDGVGQTALQLVWFKICAGAFRAANIDNDQTPTQGYIKVAELQVDNFFQDPQVGIWAQLNGRRFACFNEDGGQI